MYGTSMKEVQDVISLCGNGLCIFSHEGLHSIFLATRLLLFFALFVSYISPCFITSDIGIVFQNLFTEEIEDI